MRTDRIAVPNGWGSIGWLWETWIRQKRSSNLPTTKTVDRNGKYCILAFWVLIPPSFHQGRSTLLGGGTRHDGRVIAAAAPDVQSGAPIDVVQGLEHRVLLVLRSLFSDVARSRGAIQSPWMIPGGSVLSGWSVSSSMKPAGYIPVDEASRRRGSFQSV